MEPTCLHVRKGGTVAKFLVVTEVKHQALHLEKHHLVFKAWQKISLVPFLRGQWVLPELLEYKILWVWLTGLNRSNADFCTAIGLGVKVGMRTTACARRE